MEYRAALATLEAALQQPLPGADAHRLTEPRPRRQWPAGFDAADARHAAGLLLIFPIEGRAHVVLTVRAGTLGRHSGQVSLPGGVLEPDETFERAALREAHEEIGLELSGVRVLGPLTPIDIPVSGFRLHPIVAAADTRPRLSGADAEVAEILEVPVEHLLEPATLSERERIRDGRPLVAPAFSVAGHEIWGATSMILAEFLSLLGWPTFVLRGGRRSGTAF
jgi:8-oxo-dGTP pyrophosphatase MutT (NUDIX family)